MWRAILGRKTAVLLLAGCALGVYSNSFTNAFQYDDLHSIVENPHIRTLGNIPAFFVHPEYFSRDPDKAMYRPLVLVSLALNHAWSGREVWSYHLVNLLFHLGCTLLVWNLLRSLGRSAGAALAGGLLFAVHPLTCEPVDYISSRSELMAALGVLGGFWMHLRAEQRPDWRRSAGSVLFFAAGLLSKATAIVLPGLILARDLARGRIGWKRLAPYLAVALAYLVGVRGFLAKAVLSDPVRPLSEQLGTQAKAAAYYLDLLLFPVRLSVDHAFSVSRPSDPEAMAGILLVLSPFLLLWKGRRRFRDLLLGWAWIWIALSPTLLVPLNVLVNEHRLYLPLVGGIVLVSGLGERRPLPAGWIVLAVGFLSVLTWERNRVWRSEYTLWADAARKGPEQVRPYVFLGNYARHHGEPGKAVRFYQKALEIEPDNPTARANLGNAYQDLGRSEEAIACFRQVVADHPEWGEVRYSLGRAYQQAGDLVRAKESYLRVPEDAPHYDLVLNNLGTLFEIEGKIDSALHYYRKALDRNPESPDARANLERLRMRFGREAESLLEQGDPVRAEATCRRFLRSFPEDPHARFLLAVSLFQQGRYSESARENQRLVEEYPDFDEARLQLANVLEAAGRKEEARRQYEELLRRTRDPRMQRIAGQRLRRLLERMP